ncbi:MAG: hypothetical protein ACI8P3_001324 [Saprospiraceae bacterium]
MCVLPMLSAQEDSLLLTKNFSFDDGVYMTFESFQKNEPTYLWKDLRSNLVANPQTFLAQVEFLELKEGNTRINLEKVWGISIGGLPYIRLEKGAVKKKLTSFSALRLRGKICFFEYEDFEIVQIPMPVYNPVTGKPFMVSAVERNIKVYYSRILDFETGKIESLNVENLKYWVKDDAQLVKALESLGDDAKEKLFKSILIYDDRHKVYIRSEE